MPQIRTLVNKIEVPRVPNFIKFGDRWLSVSSFTEHELKAVAKQWAENLIKRAKEQKFVNP
jgi:hypothetical protein